jgi:hypothetical protein
MEIALLDGGADLEVGSVAAESAEAALVEEFRGSGESAGSAAGEAEALTKAGR